MTTELAAPGVAILADDLIWASRLSDAVTAAGGSPKRVRRAADLAALITGGTRLVVVDLTARAYDGVEAIAAAVAAGAERVFPYRRLFESGADVLGAWLAG